jgi:hypothetical protein
VNGERDIGRPVDRRILHDHINNNVRCPDIGENPGDNSRLITHSGNAELGLVPVETDPTNEYVFHAGRFFPCDGPSDLLKARSDLEVHPEFFGEFHRAGLHHFCATSGHLKQFIISNFANFFRVFNNSGITRENAIHIGENLAGVGIQRAR